MRQSPQVKRRLRIVGRVLAVVFVAVVAIDVSLANEYLSYPRSPDVGSGRIVAIETKGAVVYISVLQRKISNFLRWTIVLAA
jgi:hypothetical protein